MDKLKQTIEKLDKDLNWEDVAKWANPKDQMTIEWNFNNIKEYLHKRDKAIIKTMRELLGETDEKEMDTRTKCFKEMVQKQFKEIHDLKMKNKELQEKLYESKRETSIESQYANYLLASREAKKEEIDEWQKKFDLLYESTISKLMPRMKAEEELNYWQQLLQHIKSQQPEVEEIMKEVRGIKDASWDSASWIKLDKLEEILKKHLA